MQWNSLPEYQDSLDEKARERKEQFRAHRLKANIPRIPAAPTLRKVQERLAQSGEELCLGAWFDCIHGMTCQLMIKSTGPPYVTGE